MRDEKNKEFIAKLQATISELEEKKLTDSLNKTAANLIELVESFLIDSLKSPPSPSDDDLLYFRAVDDFEALQKRSSEIRSALIERDEFLNTLKKSKYELTYMQKHLQFIETVATILESFANLLQYDTEKRIEIHINNGFKIISGGSFIGHNPIQCQIDSQ